MTYALSLLPALQDLAAQLTAAGVPVHLDRAKVPVPGVWIRPDSTYEATLNGDGVVRVSALLIAPAQGEAEALGDLQGLLNRVLQVITPDDDVDTSVMVTVRSNQLPAFRVQVDLPLDNIDGTEGT